MNQTQRKAWAKLRLQLDFQSACLVLTLAACRDIVHDRLIASTDFVDMNTTHLLSSARTFQLKLLKIFQLFLTREMRAIKNAQIPQYNFIQMENSKANNPQGGCAESCSSLGHAFLRCWNAIVACVVSCIEGLINSESTVHV